jgi:hypothetical protein
MVHEGRRASDEGQPVSGHMCCRSGSTISDDRCGPCEFSLERAQIVLHLYLIIKGGLFLWSNTFLDRFTLHHLHKIPTVTPCKQYRTGSR